ncbi:MAG: hypothetical protein IKQ18_00140 [Clostridia bacterium]|jgi:hypothetical protein|nr:hypothetical protein [Clostridia bacterium]
MKLTDVISDAGRTGRYPVILTDADFVITLFNDAAKQLFKSIKEGHKLDEYAEIIERRDLQRSRYPTSALIRVKGKPYMCAFCPALMGLHKEFVLTIAVPDKKEEDDSELFLCMKVAVLTKCMETCGEFVTSSAKRAYDKLYSSYEANMRMLIALGRYPQPSNVYVKKLLEDALSYYCRFKYGGEDRKRYDVIVDEDIMIMNNILCAIIITTFNICELLSSNGYCRVTYHIDTFYDKTTTSFDFRAKSKLKSAIEHLNDVEDAIYLVLGRTAEDIYFIKSLTKYLYGKVKIEYDGNNVSFKIITPREKVTILRSTSLNYRQVLWAAVDRT